MLHFSVLKIFLVDGTLVQDLNLNLNLFPPGREKSIDILNYLNKTLVEIINTDYILINLRTNVNS